MDTSSPAVFVNGELLKLYVGRRVRALVQVMRNEGGAMMGQSTDGHQLTIRGSQPLPKSHFVEVIGIADNSQSIRAEICTDFGETCDITAYNRVCQLANGEFKSLFL
ncbi:replication protein A 14 kDa subunit-like [Magnolia sinica]|uniref:replication protein A 14 kDa subunit-like n=1 Tax=Magnolia sinica TaxID=86752 RepID=UPI002657CA2B|nr:replication protein A 14 kDa subunit-like [Magnolia sinica]XP_058077568.1 replication protein A 14 kDa subunit-like [Magnolia sinica]